MKLMIRSSIFLLFLAFYSLIGVAETVEELGEKIRLAPGNTEAMAIVDQILGWENKALFGTYPYPQPDRRLEYLSLLFSDPVMKSRGLQDLVSRRLRTQVSSEVWREQIKNDYGNALAGRNAKRIINVLPLYAYVQGYADRNMGGPTFNRRMDSLASDMRRAAVRDEVWTPLVARAVLARAAINPQDYRGELKHAIFSALPDVERNALQRIDGVSTAGVVSPHLPSVSPVVAKNPGSLPPVPAPVDAEVSANNQVPAVPAAEVDRRNPDQTIEEIIALIERMQQLEREISDPNILPTRKSNLVKQANTLFSEAVVRSKVIFRTIESGEHPPINHSGLRNERNEFSSEYLSSLRERYFLPFLYGHSRGQVEKDPQWNTPRSSALAAMALAAVIFHSRAKTSGPAIANSIKRASEAYLTTPDETLSPNVVTEMRRNMEKSQALYERVGREDIIGPERSERTFQMRADHAALVAKLPTPPFDNLNGESYFEDLNALEKSGSMEVYLELMSRLAQAEEALKRPDLTETEAKKIQTLSDNLHLVLSEMGNRPLNVKGEKTGLSSASAARRIFRDTRLAAYFRGGESPRVIAAAFYGLSSTALRHQGLTNPANLDTERVAGEALLSRLGPTVQNHPEVTEALSHFRISHGWLVPPKSVPQGPYRPADPEAEASPKGEAAEGTTRNGSAPPFLPVDWRSHEFLDRTTDPETRRLLEALAAYWPSGAVDRTARRAALEVLRNAHPSDMGMILAMADTLRANRLQTYEAATASGVPPLTNRESELQGVFRRWTREYREARRTSPMPVGLTERLLALTPHLPGEENEALSRVERELIPRLNRVFNISGDPPLIEVSSRALANVNLGLMRRGDREKALANLRGALNDALSGVTPFTEQTVRILRRVYERLGGQYREGGVLPTEAVIENPVAPLAGPTANPAVVVPPAVVHEPMTAEEIRSALNVLSGKAAERLTQRARSMVWDDLVNESLERGIKDEKAMEILVDWIKSPTEPLDSRTRALRILLHSWDHVRDIYRTNTDLGEHVDELISDLGKKANPDLKDPAFAAVINGFKRVRLGGEALGEVIRDVTHQVNCPASLEALTRSRFVERP